MQQINSLCKYHVPEGRLPVQIIRLSATRVFLSSVPEVTVTCDEANSTVMAVNHSQIVYELDCQCALTAVDVYLPPRADTACDMKNETALELHPINLRVLNEYFSESELFGLQAETLLQHKINISIPKLLLQLDRMKMTLSNN